MSLLRFVSATRRALPQVLPLLRDFRVPLWLKLACAGAALLIVSPLDLFGDIPGLGVLDDALLLALVVNGFVSVASKFAQSVEFAHVEVPMRRARPVDVRQLGS